MLLLCVTCTVLYCVGQCVTCTACLDSTAFAYRPAKLVKSSSLVAHTTYCVVVLAN